MNFIAETDRFARDLENWNKGHGYTNTDGLKDLMAIWHTFINLPERKAITYPNVTAYIPLVDHNCGKCGPLTDALTLIYSWRNSKELQNEVYVDFTGVEKAEVEEVKMSFDVPQTFPSKEEIVMEAVKKEVDKLVDKHLEEGFSDLKKESMKPVYAAMKMHKLRSFAKNRGIEYSNKTTKEELIRLING